MEVFDERIEKLVTNNLLRRLEHELVLLRITEESPKHVLVGILLVAFKDSQQ